MKKVLVAFAALAMALAVPCLGLASNGMNMIGTGAVSSGMGGADAAVPAGCTAVAGNPAQLATTCDRVISVGASLMRPIMEVTMPGRDSVENELQLLPLGFFGYAQRVNNGPFALGVGLFAQGGMGVDFKNVKNFQGQNDSLYSMVAFTRLAPTMAYNVTDKLSLGLTAFLGYATIDYEFFPNGAMGQNVTGLNSYTVAGRVGVSYQINDKWAIGATYTSESSLDFKGGEMGFNFGPGIGTVRYSDVEMDNFTWPRQIEAGISFRPAAKWLLVFDVCWVNYDSAVNTVTVKASNPNAPLPPEYRNLNIPLVMDWKDQWIFALGIAYEINDKWTVRAGYNYGSNPVPDDTMNPLFAANVEHHITAGFSRNWGNWDLDFALEHAFKNSQTNNGAPSASNPFPGTEMSHYQWTAHVMVSWRF